MATGPARWSATTDAPSTIPPMTHAATSLALLLPAPASIMNWEIEQCEKERDRKEEGDWSCARERGRRDLGLGIGARGWRRYRHSR
ncbi:Os12g0121150, partial [Oryza sativa Japonica Group]